jgi:hypothetical protein
LLSSSLAVFAQSSAFTYQGLISSNGVAATGLFDLRFAVFNANTNGSQVGGVLTNSPVGVTNGYFTTALDFGSGVFDGNLRWLEIGIRTNGSPATNDFFYLAPRQQITATPYAIRAANFSGPIGTTNITGKINDTNLSANVALLTNSVAFSGSVTATSFIGNGANLNNLNASNIATGTLADARLSTNVARLNTSNTVFFGAITATNYYGPGYGLTNVPGRIFEVIPFGGAITAWPNYGYLATNDSTPVVVTLPTTNGAGGIKIGDTVRVSGIGAAGWIIAQNTNQTILTGSLIQNAGIAWRTNVLNASWKAVGISQDGKKMVAAITGGVTYYTTNAGLNWTAGGTSANWSSLASSADGTKWIGGVNTGFMQRSVNSGASWGNTASSRAWTGVASSWDGVNLAATVNAGNPWTSTNSGGIWTERNTGATRNWTGIASSGDGLYLAACASGSQIYTSTNGGVTWTARATIQTWSSIASSADGSILVACVANGLLYVSYDFGASWISTGPNTALEWSAVACSGDGLRMIAATTAGGLGEIYVSQDAGVTWQKRSNLPSASYTGVACSGDGGAMAAVATATGIFVSAQISTTTGATGQLIGSRLAAVELQYVGGGVFIPISHEGNIRVK